MLNSSRGFIFIMEKTRKLLLCPVRQMDVSHKANIFSKEVSVSQRPYFKLFKGKQSVFTAILQQKTNGLADVCSAGLAVSTMAG